MASNHVSTVGFHEAKTMSESKNHHKINVDLIRLGIFGKNAIDAKELNAVILIQAVGANLTFYLMKKPTEDIYYMTEMNHIRFPTSLNELKGIYGFIDDICEIINVFSRECIDQVINETSTYRLSMSSPLI